MMDAVAVVLVNWNGRAHLAACLRALAVQTLGASEVIVVDNASSDGSVAWLGREWPAVQVLALGENAGFARGNNLGLAAAATPWVALLNNDTVPTPGWLAALAAAAEAGGPRLAAVASRMAFVDRPDMLNSTGISVDPTGIAWDRLGGAPFAAGDTPAPVFGASAGAGLFRRAALLDVADVGSDGRSEVFDETFFMYMEDVDLAWRLRLRGWTAQYAPAGVIYHHGSASAGEGSPFKNRLLARNKVWTVVKNYPNGPLVAWWPFIVAYDLGSAPYRVLLRGQTAAMRGRAEALAHPREALRRRHRVQARRTAAWAELRGAMAPLEPPWAVLRRYRHLAGKHAPGPG